MLWRAPLFGHAPGLGKRSVEGDSVVRKPLNLRNLLSYNWHDWRNLHRNGGFGSFDIPTRYN